MNEELKNLWAKVDKNDDTRWHPLMLHLIDVAAVAEAVLMREPESTRMMMAACLGMRWEAALPWLLLLIACHDLGKACPGFQCKWPKAPPTGFRTRRSPNTGINHAFVSQIALMAILEEEGWPGDLAALAADAVGCHHGRRASPVEIKRLRNDTGAVGGSDWSQARRELFQALLSLLKPSRVPDKQYLSGPDFMLLSGLTSFSDWIGSNEDWFPFGSPGDCEDLDAWFQDRGVRARQALDSIGWEPRTPLSAEPRSFERVFGFAPRPLQQAVSEEVAALRGPAILLLEGPMGEGKTEAAYYAHLELQRRFGHRGMYVALPTKATGNAMFVRTLDFLRKPRTDRADRALDLQLLHGAALLNDTFQNLRFSGIHDPDADTETRGEIRAGEWFTNKKRALLSEYGVGTADQAILPILPVRHNFVRLWGLANRVVVFDEIHAYDVYTGTLLVHLLRWLSALGSSVVLLSATLPPSVRRRLAGVVGATLPEREARYPRLTVFCPGEVRQSHFEADPKRALTLRVRPIPPDLSAMRAALEESLAGGGMGLALVNTVQRAQDLYRLFPEGEPLDHGNRRVGKRLADGTEVFLFHARLPADRRQAREDAVLQTFGRDGRRNGRKILIATQVAEQSLDLDFDVIATDLAPIDLVLQRAGRQWRHAGRSRHTPEPVILIAGLAGDEPPSFGKPLYWGSVYREDILLLTWSLLHERRQLALPMEIDALVQAVYEERVDVPEGLRQRCDEARMVGEGDAFAGCGLANQAIIGMPDDGSWKNSAGPVLYDEDEPGAHRTLMAQTRLGEDSVTVVPLWREDGFDPGATPEFAGAKEWFLRAVSLSRKSVVKKCQALGVPEGWKKSPLLRNFFPLELDERGRWTMDASVRLDDDLGVVYESKENE